MTLDEKAIAKLLARRTSVIDAYTARIARLDAAHAARRAALSSEGFALINSIEAKITYIQSAPRYARPKQVRAPTAAKQLALEEERRRDEELMNQIAAQRAEAERTRQQENSNDN